MPVSELVDENYLVRRTDLVELASIDGIDGVSVEPIAGGDCGVAE